MTPENKKFILKKLIPFILREQGRGFQMGDWKVVKEDIGNFKYFHEDLQKYVKWPKCDSVFCIGGSAQVLLNILGIPGCSRTDDLAKGMGISRDEAEGLFYEWGVNTTEPCAWPISFARDFAKAKTPLGKAKVAVALLKEVVRTEGKCLHRK